jgi:hypothetical protein
MSRTLALQQSAERPRDPHTLGTLAASLVACTHPEPNQLRAPGSSDGADPIWCAACGALRFGEGPASRWQLAALPSLLTRKHFEEVVLVLHCVRQLTLLTGREASSGSAVHGAFRRVRASLTELARLPLVRQVDQLDEAIAALPPSPAVP